MIGELSIRNFALIGRLTVEFYPGFKSDRVRGFIQYYTKRVTRLVRINSFFGGRELILRTSLRFYLPY